MLLVINSRSWNEYYELQKGNTTLDNESHLMWPIVRMQVCIRNGGRTERQFNGLSTRGQLTLLTYLALLHFSGADSITMPWLVLMWRSSSRTCSQLCIHWDSRTLPYHSAYKHGCSMRSRSSSSIHRRDKTPPWIGLPHGSISCGIAAAPSLCVNPRAPSSTCNQSCQDHCRQWFGRWNEPQLP